MMKTLFPGLITFILGLLLLSGAVNAQSTEPELPPAIVHFAADVTALSLAEVESGAAEVALSWTVVGLRDGDALGLETMALGDWEPLTDDRLDAVGAFNFLAGRPLGFAPPTYRLVIRDAGGEIIDAWVLTIPYAGDDEAAPTITVFESEGDSISRADLQAGSAEVLVRWEVANRTPTSNLIFEQILPDGTSVSVEKTRPIRWVPSAGQGEVLLVDADAIILRLSLVDLVSGEALDSAETAIGIEESVAEANGDDTDASAAPSTISAFTVSQRNADYGDTVEINWTVSNAADITLQVTPLDRISETLGEGLPNTGSLTYTLPEDGIYHRVNFLLIASNSAGQSEEREFTLFMNCAVPWFFNAIHAAANCSAQPGAEINAAHQYFERGMMLWRVDTDEIYVFGHDGRYEIFEDTWAQGEDFTSGETPPDGLFVPMRGFGKVWAQQNRVRDELGWAIGPETSYRMQVQDEVPVFSAFRRYVSIPGNHVIFLDVGTALAPMGTWGTVGR